MTCPLGLDLVAYAKGELPPRDEEAVRAHLPTCADCQEELDAVEEVMEGLGSLPRVAPSQDFATRVQKALSADAEYVQLAKETKRREKEETVRRHGWLGWAGRSLSQRVTSAPGWLVAAAVYLLAFGALIWVLVPKRTHPSDLGSPHEDQHGLKPPTIPGGDQNADTNDPLRVDGTVIIVKTRTEASSRAAVSADTAKSIERGLAWLAKQQREDGCWWATVSTLPTMDEEHECCTALATLAFLGDGHRSTGGTYQETVRRAVKWIIAHQGSDGALSDNLELHGALALCVAEDLAFGTADKGDVTAEWNALQSALAHTRGLQNEDGGWSRAARQGAASDLSSTLTQVYPLRLGRALGVKGCYVPLTRAHDWAIKGGKQLAADMKNHERVVLSPWNCAWESTVADQAAEGSPGLLLLDAWLEGVMPSNDLSEQRALLEKSVQEVRSTRPERLRTGWGYGTAEALRQWEGTASAATRWTLEESLLKSQSSDGGWPENSEHNTRAPATSCALLALEAPYRYPQLLTPQVK